MHSVAFLVFCPLSVILLLLALPIHIRTRNTGALLLIGWLLCSNIVTLVNAILFWDSVANKAPVWCDISIRLTMVFPSGFAAGSLCIHRQLASIAASRSIGMTRRQRHISLAIDLACGIGIPICMMVLGYIPQGHRFDIIEGMSPSPPLWPCLATTLMMYLPPVLLCVVSLAYGIVAIRFFVVHRMRFQALLKASHSGLDTSHYIRLMAIAGADLLMSLPLAIVFLVTRSDHLRPWTSWDDIHQSYSRVALFALINFPAYYGLPQNLALASIGEWLGPLLTMLVFILFGVSDEAIRGYTRLFQRGAQCWLVRSTQSSERSPFQPSLGSKVVKATGSHWTEADPESGDEYGPRIRDMAPTSTAETAERSKQGIVAVTVERDVV